jgi:hypothetical protein
MRPIRSTALALVAILALSLSPLALAQQAAPSAAQVEQLQAQLTEMQKEMAAMRKALEGSGDIPTEKRQMMQQHMGGMERYWKGMHDQCCMMNPAGCSPRGSMQHQ